MGLIIQEIGNIGNEKRETEGPLVAEGSEVAVFT